MFFYDVKNDVFTHVFNSVKGESLTKSSDQTVESAHQQIEKVLRWTNSWVKVLESPQHGDKLFRGIMIHNTYVMDAMNLKV